MLDKLLFKNYILDKKLSLVLQTLERCLQITIVIYLIYLATIIDKLTCPDYKETDKELLMH